MGWIWGVGLNNYWEANRLQTAVFHPVVRKTELGDYQYPPGNSERHRYRVVETNRSHHTGGDEQNLASDRPSMLTPNNDRLTVYQSRPAVGSLAKVYGVAHQPIRRSHRSLVIKQWSRNPFHTLGDSLLDGL